VDDSQDYLFKELNMANLTRFDPFEDGFFNLLPAILQPRSQAMSNMTARMDLIETDEEFQLAVELPGVKKEAIQVSISENQVTISADMREEKEAGDKGEYILRERTFGKVGRQLVLPAPVEDEGAQARYENGMLYLRLPKRAAARTKRLTVH
jgi:HSP20 family protein